MTGVLRPHNLFPYIKYNTKYPSYLVSEKDNLFANSCINFPALPEGRGQERNCGTVAEKNCKHSVDTQPLYLFICRFLSGMEPPPTPIFLNSTFLITGPIIPQLTFLFTLSQEIFAETNFRGFRVFWPNPRNISELLHRENKFRRNISKLQTAKINLREIL